MHMYAFIHVCSNDNLKGCQCERKQREKNVESKGRKGWRWETWECLERGKKRKKDVIFSLKLNKFLKSV